MFKSKKNIYNFYLFIYLIQVIAKHFTCLVKKGENFNNLPGI